MDSRGHGRSTRDARPYGYDLMADDVVALMDSLKIAKADIVGWSDGAILSIDLAMRHKERVRKVFAFADNTMTSGVKDGVEENPTFIQRGGHEYETLSASPQEYDAFVDQISKMWAEQPNWSDAQLEATLPGTAALRREQIRFQVALANALMHIKGYAAPDTKASLDQGTLVHRASGIARRSSRRPTAVVLRPLRLLGRVAAQFLALAEKQRATVPLMIGHRLMGTSLVETGDIAEGRGT